MSQVFYRAVAAAKDDPLGEPYTEVLGRFGSNVRAGYLMKRGTDWYVKPAKKPGDLSWPEKGAYLKVKEADIPAGEIPNFIPFNSPGYRPQYHPVSFEVGGLQGQRGRFVVITQIGPPEAGYPHRGTLVCSGNMLETGSETTISPRKNHALVLEADDKAKPLKINIRAVIDYLDALTPFQTEAPFDKYMGCLLEARPIFFIEREGEVQCFGHTPHFRVPALSASGKRAATPLDFVPPELRRPEDTDYAEALFGFVRTREQLEDMKQRSIIQNLPRQGDKNRAYAGRVYVSEASLVEGQSDIWLSDQPMVPRILSTPKPMTFQHYLVQTSDEKNMLKHYGSPTPHGTVIRGHKRYWHQGMAPLQGSLLTKLA